MFFEGSIVFGVPYLGWMLARMILVSGAHLRLTHIIRLSMSLRRIFVVRSR